MRTLTKKSTKSNKQKVFKEVSILSPEQYDELELDAKVELIRALIPLGLMRVARELEAEVGNISR